MLQIQARLTGRLQRRQRRAGWLRVDLLQGAPDRPQTRRHREAVGGNGVAEEPGERRSFIFREIDNGHARDMAVRRQRDETAPLTLGLAAAGHVRLIVWCKSCSHRIEPDPAELVARHGETPTVIEWATRLVCSKCGAREADFVVTGARR